MKIKKIFTILSLCALIPAVSTLSTSCSKHEDVLEDFLDVDYTWDDVEHKKNSMINGIERNSGIEWRSSKKLQAKYLKEEDYTKERAETYQSNLELELDKFKEQPNASANDAFDLLNEEEQKENLNTFDWALVNKHMDGLKNDVYAKISTIEGLTDKDKASLYDDVCKKFNEILFNAKNQKLDFQGTMDYIDSEIDKYITEEIPSKSKKMIAQNSLYSFVTSQDFSINEKLLDGDGTFSFKLWEQSSTDQEKKAIEDKMLSNLFTFEKLPVNEGTVSKEYSFSFKINDLKWTNLITTKLNITFVLADKDSKEELASCDFSEIEVIENKPGLTAIFGPYLQKITYDKNEDPATYTSFKKQVEADGVNIDGEKFLTNDLIQYIASINLNSLSLSEKEQFAEVTSNNSISFGAFCEFVDDDQKTSGTAILTPCIYDPSILSSSEDKGAAIIAKSENKLSFSLAVSINDDAKEVLFNEDSVISTVDSINSSLSSYDYYANENNLKEVEKNANDTTHIYGAEISYIVFGSLSNVISFIVDAATAPLLITLDFGFIAFDVYEMMDSLPWAKTMKEVAHEQRDEFLNARNSEEFKEIEEAVKNGNLRQVQREIETEAKEFLTETKDAPNSYEIKDPEQLIRNFEEKYGLNRENAVKKIGSRQRDKIQLLITSLGGSLQVITNAAKLYLWGQATTFFEKSIRIMDFNAYSMSFLPGLSRDLDDLRGAATISTSRLQDIAFGARTDMLKKELKLFDTQKAYDLLQKDLAIMEKAIENGDDFLFTAHTVLDSGLQNVINEYGSIAAAQKDLVGFRHLDSLVLPERAFGSDPTLLAMFQANRSALDEGKHFLDNAEFLTQWHDSLINEGIPYHYKSLFREKNIPAGETAASLAKKYMPNTYNYYTEQINKIIDINYTSKLPEIQKQLLDVDMSIWASTSTYDINLSRNNYLCKTAAGEQMIQSALSDTRAHKYIENNFENWELGCSEWTCADPTKASREFVELGFEDTIELTSKRVKYYGYSGGTSGQKLTKYGFCQKVSERNSVWLKRAQADSGVQQKIYEVLSDDIPTETKKGLLTDIQKESEMIYTDQHKWESATAVQYDATSFTNKIEKLETFSFWAVLVLSIVSSALREYIYEFKTRMQIFE